MSGELSFFELGVADAERGRVFYQGLFGWKFDPGPGAGGSVIETPNVRGGIHGADPAAAPLLFFRVPDIDQAMARVRELGGEVQAVDVEGDADSISRFGRFKLCRDDQGSPFGLHQPPSGG